MSLGRISNTTFRQGFKLCQGTSGVRICIVSYRVMYGMQKEFRDVVCETLGLDRLCSKCQTRQEITFFCEIFPVTRRFLLLTLITFEV